MIFNVLSVAGATRKTKLSGFSLQNKKLDTVIITIIAFLACFILAFIAGSFIIQPYDTKAATGLGLAGSSTISISTSNSSVSLRPNPTANSGLASDITVITANTNVPTGYNISLSATSAGTSLTASTGTITSPTTLADNTWGYALANTSAVGVTNGFDASYAYPTPSSSSKWANPTTATTIKSTSTTATNDTTNVYYGVKAGTSLTAGTYSSTVTYTETANVSSLATPSITSVTPSSGTTAGGTAIAIVGMGFTYNDSSVTTAVTVGGQTCTSFSMSSNTPETGKDTIYCNTPARTTAGAVNVAVTTWKSAATLTNGYTYAAPTATITAPTASQILAAGTTSTTLSVTTDIAATCYYGTATSPTTVMTTTGGTSHSVSITGLANASTNTHYVRCNAASGHSYGTEKSVTFYVRTATPSAPTLSPASGASVNNGTTTITATSSGATCTWGTSSGSYPNASGTTRTTTTGTNTLYYSCVAGSGNTISAAKTGSWSYTGKSPVAATGDKIQTVTTATCPSTRTRVNDARDDKTYWIQKLADGKCWMLTNLAYGGGGTNTYGDTKTITNSNSMSYTTAYYMIPTGSSVTSGTTDPSTSTSGTGQYGYLYNWCAAMGVQTSTSACADATTPAPDASVSICPSGWRLPTGNTGGEFQALNTAVNSGSTSSSSGLLSVWLGMYTGVYSTTTFTDLGNNGRYWSSTQNGDSEGWIMYFTNTGYVGPGITRSNKRLGLSVRCVAN